MNHNVWKCMLITMTTLLLTSAMIQKLQMPEGLQGYFNGAKIRQNTSEIPGEQIFWECMQKVMWQMADMMGHNVTQETRDYFDRLLQIAINSHNTQIPRHRKEYRMLTDEERARFHKAIVALKNDNSLKPNVYSALAQMHAGDVIPMAHFGANFLGWHRVYILVFETALRMKDPVIAIPYWASNLDNEMDDPSKSIIWSKDFLGNGDGFVSTGPFKNFQVLSTDSVLLRNVGASGSLHTNEGIHGILSQNRTEQISNPHAMFETNLEKQHNTVHRWVGGSMDVLSTSAEDPVFYLHHSFVDYIWEEFRTKQKMLKIDPETDYPKTNYGTADHAPDAPLGFGDLQNIDALSNVFADLVKYDPSPTCSLRHPTCGSKYLRCDLERPIPVCVSLSREEVSQKLDDELEICVEPHLSRSIQNNFAINQFCDIRKWAYITVSVILQRPPEFAHYNAFPVKNNEPVFTTDIFSTLSNNQNVSNILATYPNCRRTNSVARKIFIESHGLNYYGIYKEFTVLDQRHALSSATTYIGIKNPEINVTDVILYAYDFCGRSCRPYCLDLTLSPPKSKPCAGVIRVTADEPRLYGRDYAEAVNNVWRSDNPDDLPEVAQHPAAVTFYCDYSGAWPWDEAIQMKHSKPKPSLDTKTRALKKSSVPQRNSTSTDPVRKKSLNAGASKIYTNLKRMNHIGMGAKRINAKSVHTTKTVNSLGHIPTVRTFDLRSATSRPTLPGHKIPMNRQAVARGKVTNNRPARMRKLIAKSRRVQNIRNMNSNIKSVSSNQRTVRRNPLLRHSENIRNPELQTQRLGVSTRLVQCRLGSGCILAVPCSPCQPRTRAPCHGPRRLFAICVNGTFMLEHLFFNFHG